MVGMILERMETLEWKIGEKIDGMSIWLGGEGREREKWWGQLFSLQAHQIEEKMEKVCFGPNCHSPPIDNFFVFFFL